MKLLYLACPYTGTAQEREMRFQEATRVSAFLMTQGFNVFSPLTHSHLIAQFLPEFTNTHGFWLTKDKQILKFCDELHILKLPGWENSLGVQEERAFAEDNEMPIVYWEYPNEENKEKDLNKEDGHQGPKLYQG